MYLVYLQSMGYLQSLSFVFRFLFSSTYLKTKLRGFCFCKLLVLAYCVKCKIVNTNKHMSLIFWFKKVFKSHSTRKNTNTFNAMVSTTRVWSRMFVKWLFGAICLCTVFTVSHNHYSHTSATSITIRSQTKIISFLFLFVEHDWRPSTIFFWTSHCVIR